LDKLSSKQGRAPRKVKSFSETMMFRTGSCYASGIATGAGIGFVQGLVATRSAPNLKLRINGMLNYGGRLGSKLANGMGVMAILYSMNRSLFNTVRKRDDVYNQVGAGALTGLMFRGPKGPTAALIGGVSVGALVWSATFAGEKLEEETQGQSKIGDFLLEFF
jgi:inner membrane translocase subunit Tim23